MASEQAYRVGDCVTWESQSGGYTKSKTGGVVYVAPLIINKRLSPIQIAADDFPDHQRMFDGLTFPPGAVLVEVRDGKTDKAKPKLYMPRLSALHLADNKNGYGDD